MSDFAGRTAMVTGAAGGIGSATALEFARRGAALVLLDRKLELLDDVNAACTEAGAPTVQPLGVDQTDREAVEEAVRQSWDRHGRVDVLFANAGYGKFSPFLETPLREWMRHVDVNLTGTFHMCQAVARAMASDRQGGAIVVSASSGAEQHADQLSAYCSTKAALRMLSIGMASELGVHRIRVNSVMPGVIESPMTAGMLAEGGHREVLLAETPVGRLGRPQDVAELVCFLASERAAFITGHAVMIDGGQTIHGHPRWFRMDYRQAHDEQWDVGR